MELMGHANVLDWRGFERFLGLTENGEPDDYLIAFPGCLAAGLSDEIIEECYSKLLRFRKAGLSATRTDRTRTC
jgi:hypothetical protein